MLEARSSGFWDATREQAPSSTPHWLALDTGVNGRPDDSPGPVQVPTGCRRKY